MTPTVLIGAACALVIGLGLGLLGGGGTLLTLPMLIYVLGVSPREAIPGSLLVVAVTSTAAFIVHARAGRVRFRVGLTFATTAMAGAYAGGHMAQWVPINVLLLLFGVMMVAVAVGMINQGSRPAAVGVSTHRPALVLVIGLFVGLVSGLVGAGGGFMIVPALTLVGGLAMSEAVATSLLVIMLQSVAGFLGHSHHVPANVALFATVAAVSTAGSVVGAWWSTKVSPAALRTVFACFILAVGSFLVIQRLPPGVPRILGAAGLAVAVGAVLGLSYRDPA